MGQFRPLRGVRILSFEAAFSLPAGTRTLAELGADVVQVSRPARVSGDYITVVDGNALSKSSLAVDLRHAEGQSLARRLALVADAVCNNFRPRVLRGYGLDPAALRAARPDLIWLQLSGYGTPGPWQDYPAYGPSVEAVGGMNALSGEADDPPVRVGSGVFADQASGRYAALALIAALERRRRTGQGAEIDLSMYESIVHLLGDRIVSGAARGAPPTRRGNRDAVHAPQGIYPCRSDERGTLSDEPQDAARRSSLVAHRSDQWLALTVATDAQWRALRELVGDDRLCDPTLERAEGRRAANDAIDAVIAAWTRGLEKNEAAALLQARGIAAGPVQAPGDLLYDPHLAARGAFSIVRHARPFVGAEAHPHLTTPWTARGSRRHALEDAPGDGAHNARVLRRWLGLRPAQVARLEREGALMAFRAYQPVPPVGELPPSPPDLTRFAPLTPPPSLAGTGVPTRHRETSAGRETARGVRS